MEQFGFLPWRISEPSTLDVGTNFIKEENISKSTVYKNDFTPYEFTSDSDNDEPLIIKPKLRLPKYPHTSRLNKTQQLICLNALSILQTERQTNSFSLDEQQKINTYNNLKLHINEENALFLKFVEKEWNRQLNIRSKKMLKRMLIFGTNKWKSNLKTITSYKQYYKVVNMLPISIPNNPVEIMCEGPVLELGTVGKIVPPYIDEQTKCNLNLIPSINGILKTDDETLKYTKYPISRDIYAEQLAKTNNCNIVITSSGLKTIIDNYGPDFQKYWDIPVVVKDHKINGKQHNIIFIDKPLPQKNISYIDLNVKCRKILLKTNLCKKLAHRFLVSNLPVSPKTETIAEEKVANSPKTTTLDVKSDKRVTRNSTKQSFENGEIVDSDPEDVGLKTKRVRNSNIKIHHNVSYRIWKLKLKTEEISSLLKGCTEGKELKILVRSKTDGLQTAPNGALIPMTLVPKLEFQWEYGGEQVSRSEVLRQWTTLFFRPFSHILRVRMNATNQDYIKTEMINLNKIISEGLKHYNLNPASNLGVLYNVLSNLVNLNIGEYLLHHTTKHGPFVAIMESSINSTSDTLDLYELYKGVNCKIEDDLKWRPVDPKLVMPIHSLHGLMPGMFPSHKDFKPFNKFNKNTGNGKGKKKNKKKKRKAKPKNKNSN